MAAADLSRREVIQLTACGAGAAALAAASPRVDAKGKGGRPNLLFIFADQQHWDAVGFQNSFFRTPNLDKLAAGGTVFERSFCCTPQCSPTRSSILTGLYPSATGVMGNVGAAGGKALKSKTVGARLQEAGYRTGYFGKWHLGNDATGNAGWDEAVKKTNDKISVAAALKFLRAHDASGKPFAMFVSINDPHDVYHFKPGAKDVSAEKIKLSRSWREETFAGKPPIHEQFMTADQGTKIWGQPQDVWEQYHDFYREKVRLYDACVGKVLEALDAAGLTENTVVMAGSDHGDMDTNHKLIFKGPFMYEHMVRVPLIVRVPSAFGGGDAAKTPYPVTHADITPTLLDFAGGGAIECHGASLKPLLTGGAAMPKRDFVVSQYYSKQQWVNPIRMIRTERYKYNQYIEHGAELYDLVNDPEELTNLAGDAKYAKAARELKGELDKWIEAHDDPFYSFKTVPLKAGRGKKKATSH